MISRLKLLKGALLGAAATAAAVLLPTRAQAQGTTTGLHYQGRLTSPDGTPVADGSYDVTFGLFAMPTGGAALWTESSTVATKGGAFTTMLGRATPFPPGLFGQALWLGIAVGGRSLVPRQELGASAYAMTALNVAAGAVSTAMIVDSAVTTAKLADGAVTKEKLAPELQIPVGTVISWWGNANVLPPAGWRLCDGGPVDDAQSPLNGVHVPDLTGRFIRGAIGDVRTTPQIGGSDQHMLTEAQMPIHTHGVNDPGHVHSISGLGWDQGTFDPGRPRTDANSPKNGWALGTEQAKTGITIQNAGANEPFSTVPAFYGLVYLIRVR